MSASTFFQYGRSYMEKLPAAPAHLMVVDGLVADVTEYVLELRMLLREAQESTTAASLKARIGDALIKYPVLDTEP
jgi:hypothetical protein